VVVRHTADRTANLSIDKILAGPYLSNGKKETIMQPTLTGWDIARFDEIEWMPWGGDQGEARAKALAVADGAYMMLVEAGPGYQGGAHEHAYPEFLYVIEGTLRTQGVELKSGDGYAAAPGSVHTDFATDGGATYLVVFKV
jgi:anti-sigma factor ChrR (cupin superfamily)